jgi:hypothetical protein
MEALVKIQNELKVPKGKYNTFGRYKYRTAEQILEAVKPILLKYNAMLRITDSIEVIGSKLFLKATATIWYNECRNYIESNGFAEMSEHKGMSAEQATGTASSYSRKYALNGLFLIDESEADADSIDADKQPIEAVAIEPKKQPIETARFNKAIAALKEGKTRIEAIESFELTPSQQEQLQLYKNSKI